LKKADIDDQMIRLEADTKALVTLEKAMVRKKAIKTMVENEVEKL